MSPPIARRMTPLPNLPSVLACTPGQASRSGKHDATPRGTTRSRGGRTGLRARLTCWCSAYPARVATRLAAAPVAWMPSCLAMLRRHLTDCQASSCLTGSLSIRSDRTVHRSHPCSSCRTRRAASRRVSVDIPDRVSFAGYPVVIAVRVRVDSGVRHLYRLTASSFVRAAIGDLIRRCRTRRRRRSFSRRCARRGHCGRRRR